MASDSRRANLVELQAIAGRTLSRRRFAGFAAGTVAASLLAACGGSSSDTTPTTASSSAQPTATKAATSGGTGASASPATGGTSASPVASGSASPATGGATTTTGEKPVQGGTLVFALNIDAKTLDPAKSAQFSERYVMYSVYNTVVGWDHEFNLIPALAASWEVGSDGKTITFKIQPNVKFHDGTDCDATAIKWNFDRILNPDTKSNQRDQLTIIDSSEAVDKSTLKVVLKQPSRPFLATLGDRPGFVVSPAGVQKFGEDFGRNPVGSGPFKFVEWVPDNRIVLQKFDGYFEQGQPYLDKIELRHVPDTQVQSTMIRTGEATLIDALDATLVTTLKSAQDVVVEEFNGWRWYASQWQVDHPPFDNADLRSALAYATDRETINKVVWGGQGRPGAHPIVGGWAYDPALDSLYAYNLDKAKELIQKSGAAGQTFELHFSNTQLYSSLAQLLQSQYQKLGIKIDLKPENPADTFQMVHDRKISWVLTNWTPRADPDGLLRILWYSTGFQNYMGYKNPQVDQLLDQAAAEFDTKKAAVLYHQAEKLIVEDASFIFFEYPKSFSAHRKQLKGFQFYPDYVLRLRYMWLSQ